MNDANGNGHASANGTTMKAVYTVVDRGSGKSFWTRVGVGFVNRDGSLNLRLDAIPINGTLQVRDWEPADRYNSSSAQEGRPRREVRAGGPPRPPTPQDTSDGALV